MQSAKKNFMFKECAQFALVQRDAEISKKRYVQCG